MNVLVIEDHPLVRMGVCALIRKRWPDAVLVEAETLDQAEATLSTQRPDLIIVDLSLPDADGTEAPTRALAMAHGVPVIVLSARGEADFAASLIGLGVSGYVTKDRASGVLSHAIARVLAGGRYVATDIV